jgi:hypothetical protein
MTVLHGDECNASLRRLWPSLYTLGRTHLVAWKIDWPIVTRVQIIERLGQNPTLGIPQLAPALPQIVGVRRGQARAGIEASAKTAARERL